MWTIVKVTLGVTVCIHAIVYVINVLLGGGVLGPLPVERTMWTLFPCMAALWYPGIPVMDLSALMVGLTMQDSLVTWCVLWAYVYGVIWVARRVNALVS